MKRIFIFLISMTFFVAAISAQEKAMPLSCDPVSLPITESFEGDFPPTCWQQISGDGSWEKSGTHGNSPFVVSPHSGSFMALYDASTQTGYVSGDKAQLISPPFFTEGKDQGVYFWLWRSSEYPDVECKVNIYLTATGDITGMSPLATFHRSYELSPAESQKGWYQYRVLLPCAAMNSAYVVIESEKEYMEYGLPYGAPIYIDDVKIDGICMPVRNFSAVLWGSQPYKDVKITWDMPAGGLSNLTGYNLYRNNVLIAGNHTSLSYTDTNLASGAYTYSIEAVYNDACGASEKLFSPAITVTHACSGLLKPNNLTGSVKTAEWHNIDIVWEDPTETTLTYANYPESAMGSEGEFMIAMRIKPENLTAYNGKYLRKVSFVPNESGITYHIKIWQGGSGFNPGTEIVSQAVNASSLNIGIIWNTVALTTPVLIDASKELWVGIRYENQQNYPAGFDNGPLAEDGVSNLVFYQGAWTTLKAINSSIQYNWSIGAIVRLSETEEKAIGYNILRNNELLTNSGLHGTTSYRDLVSGPGTYTYKVSSVYDNFCESEYSSVTLTMPEGPCDNIWEIPFKEDFESGKFVPWCWHEESANSAPWQLTVGAGEFPVCVSHSGNKMALFNSYRYSGGRSGRLITPPFRTENNSMLSFWIYREADHPNFTQMEDRVNIYLSETGVVGNAQPLLTVHRSIEMDPVLPEKGWYEYRVPLQTSGMAEAYVIIEGVSAWGYNIYMDDIMIFDPDACSKPEELTITQPFEKEVHLSWSAPVAEDVVGYKILRDNQVIKANTNETSYIDKVTAFGTYKYSVVTLYNKSSCTESAPVDATINVLAQCDPVTEVVAKRTGDRNVQITWKASEASGLKNYSVFRGNVHVGDTNDNTISENNVEAGSHIYEAYANYEGKNCTISEAAASNAVRIEYCEEVSGLKGVFNKTNVEIQLSWEFDHTEPFKETLFQEDFTNGISQEWLNVGNDSDFDYWTYSETGGVAGGCVYSRSLADFGTIGTLPITPDNWLISPPVYLYGTEILEYYIGLVNPGVPGDHYGVFISTTGAEFNNFIPLFEETLTTNETQWTLKTVDLSAYKGTVRIAFRHYDCYGKYALKLDAIKVKSEWGIPAFEVYRDDQLISTVNERQYIDKNVKADELYTYCINPVYTNCSTNTSCIDVRANSISTMEKEIIAVYPNPSNAYITVNGTGLETIEMYNITGQLVGRFIPDTTPYNMDVSRYPQGTYLLKIMLSNKKVINKPVIILR